MKHSLWRLISSFYILLISGLMVIISAYAWMVISKAPGVSGSSTNVNIPKVFYDTITISKETLDTFPIVAVEHTISEEEKTIEFEIDSAEDFYVVMRAIENGGIPQGVEHVKLRLCTQISLENTSVWNAGDWKGVQVNALNITIYADTDQLETSSAYIYRLPDTLFQSVNSGSIAFYDITILEAEITGDGHVGAFVSYAEAQSSVSLKNCHVVESNLVSTGASAGGLLGYTNAANVLIRDCSVQKKPLQGESLKMIGSINGGETVIADAKIDALYGSLSLGETGMLNLVNTDLATVDVYGGFIQTAADCFNQDIFWQTWTVHGTSKMKNEIRFQGNHVDIVGTNNAVIELSENAGFNFGLQGVYPSSTAQFQANSSVKFADITFENTKETNGNTDIAYYMYANARNVVYSNCNFDSGVLVIGSAHFSNCEITENEKDRYCIKFVGGTFNDALGAIADSKLTAGENAKGCVLVEGTKQLFAIYDSDFYNETQIPAVYVTGSMPLLTDGKNYFDSACGGILAATEGSCSFNDPEMPCPTFAQYQAADIVDQAYWDRTEHGNNAAVRYPDSDISYADRVVSGYIPSEIQPDSTDTDTNTKTYFIDSTEEFIDVMNMLNAKDENGASVLSGHYRIVLRTHIDLTDYDWVSVSINDTNKTLKTITVEAETATLGASSAFIKQLNAPLFDTLQSASGNMVFKNITVVHSVMNLETEEYSNSGAFISVAKMSVSLDHCHLMNSTITSAPTAEGEYSRLGGLIGYTNAAEVLIQNCSVRGCVLKGASTGGIVGHASASQSNETYIVDCFVDNTEMTCLEAGASWRVGEIVGTANQGGVTIVNPLVLQNTLIQTDASDKQKNEQTQGNDPNYFLYGRFSPSKTGRMLFVDNKSAIHKALVYGGLNSKSARYLTSNEQLWLIYDTVTLKEEIRFAGNNITLKAFGESATMVLNSNSTSVFWKGGVSSPSGFNFGEVGEYQTSFKQNSKITFENLTIKNQKTYYSTKIPRYDERTYTYALAETVCYRNCVLESGVAVYANATFENCGFSANADSGFGLVLSKERITAGAYTCVLTDCEITADMMKTNGRDYEIIQTPTE